jgi:hypothetical protein
MAEYNWNDPSNIITAPNQQQVDALLALLLSGSGSSSPSVLPAVRFSLNAAYWLDVPTAKWAANRDKYPSLSEQYRKLLDELVRTFTGAGVGVILDLHWNDDVTEQQGMALRSADQADPTSTGDSVEFWSSLAQRYGHNELVMYELYNEPFVADYTTWLQGGGGGGFEGMQQMYDAVRQHTPNVVIVAGAANYAYDAESLVRFEQDVSPSNVLYNLHPYMGPYQKDDPSKNIDGYEARVDRVLEGTGRPLIITEFGQYCCAADGACYLYDGVYDGDAMGFTEAVLTVNVKYGVSWTAWAWRPNGGQGECLQPDANDGVALYDPSRHSGGGADWSALFPKFYGLVTSQ